MGSPLATRRLAVAIVVAAASAGALWASSSRLDARVDPADTKMLTQPAVSATHLAFIYGGDLYVADLGADVSNVRRLTADDGVESNPAFSPDGKTIAFSAQYDGNTDVYTVPLAGGAPARLTWHPGADTVQGFTPDGRSVLFTSQRATFTTRYAQLFTVPVQGGIEEALPIPNASRATYSPDGLRIAYNPLAARFLQWKQYRGGTASRLWLYSVKGHAVEKIPQPATRANDTDPMWMGDTVLLPVGPRRRVQPVRLRYEEQAGAAAHAPRRLPGADRFLRRQPHRLRTGRIAAPVRSSRRRARRS